MISPQGVIPHETGPSNAMTLKCGMWSMGRSGPIPHAGEGKKLVIARVYISLFFQMWNVEPLHHFSRFPAP